MARTKPTKKAEGGASQQSAGSTDRIGALLLSSRAQVVLCLVVLLGAVLIYFAPLAFGGKTPVGGDVLGNIGKTHQIDTYKRETGKPALWNPYVFSGMPNYHRRGAEVWCVDTLIRRLLGTSSLQSVAFLLIGVAGMFVLLRSVGLGNFSALLGALCFLLIPHWRGILQAGHFGKLRCIMMMPWALASFLLMLERQTLIGWVAFVLALFVQLRTQHYQIIFYTGLLLLAVSVKSGAVWLKKRKYGRIAKGTLLASLAVVVVAAMAAQQLWVTREYAPYSIRGGTGKTGSTGLDLDYATKWSLAPKEMFTFLMPRFYGGTSSERYTGDAVPPEIMNRFFRNRRIPGYWGDMPFSGNTEYLGIVALVLAALGVYACRRNHLILTLSALSVFCVFLSFGRHFPGFYGLFFEYVPAFNKFRVPSMILVLVMFVVPVLAAHGADTLLQVGKSRIRGLQKAVLWICAALMVMALVPFLLGSAFPLERPGEAQRYGYLLPHLRSARCDMMKSDAVRLALFAVAIGGFFWGYLRVGSSRRQVLAIGLLSLVLVDYVPVGSRFLTADQLASEAVLEQIHFAKSGADSFLREKLEEKNKDGETFRIFPVGELFNSNDWGYYHQPISGYDAAKLRVTQDVIESCLYRGWDPEVPINWNVVNMLNVEYLIATGLIKDARLELAYTDTRKGLFVHRNVGALPTAFFVENYEVIPDGEDRLRRLNDGSFDPSRSAILEFDPGVATSAVDASAKVSIKRFHPADSLVVRAENPHPGLLVVSEIYYPKGWRAYIDGANTRIFKTNHLLRSVWVPSGRHNIEFRFEPETYFRAVAVGWYSTLVVYLLLLAELARQVALKRRKQQTARPRGQVDHKEANPCELAGQG